MFFLQPDKSLLGTYAGAVLLYNSTNMLQLISKSNNTFENFSTPSYVTMPNPNPSPVEKVK